MIVGGGLDVGFRKGFGFCIVQLDWISTHFRDVTNNSNGRASAGIVLKFLKYGSGCGRLSGGEERSPQLNLEACWDSWISRILVGTP